MPLQKPLIELDLAIRCNISTWQCPSREVLICAWGQMPHPPAFVHNQNAVYAV